MNRNPQTPPQNNNQPLVVPNAPQRPRIAREPINPGAVGRNLFPEGQPEIVDAIQANAANAERVQFHRARLINQFRIDLAQPAGLVQANNPYQTPRRMNNQQRRQVNAPQRPIAEARNPTAVQRNLLAAFDNAAAENRQQVGRQRNRDNTDNNIDPRNPKTRRFNR